MSFAKRKKKIIMMSTKMFASRVRGKTKLYYILTKNKMT